MRRRLRPRRSFVVFLPGVLLQVFLLVVWGGVIAAGAADGQDPSASQGTPRIQVDEDFVDFGNVPLEHVIQYRIFIKNVGDAPLKVENICHDGIIHARALEGC